MTMTTPTALLLAALVAAPAEPPNPWREGGEASLDAALTGLAGKPLPDRLRQVSDGFLGTPYGFSPLGEGEGAVPDGDPLFRLDVLDCLTFAEEVMALALSKDVASAKPMLERIRYRADRPAGPDYAWRNHLMEADWVPSNVQQGFVQDITDRVGGRATVDASMEVSPGHWAGKVGARLALPASRQVVGRFPLRVLPVKHAAAKLKGAPSGTLMLLVREAKADLPTRVSHVAWLFRDKGKVFVRHASSDARRVVDEPLERFVARGLRKKQSWPLVGYALFEVRAPSP
ncbi:MAG: hypothetical protein RL653_2863 [Pseudomonadota bacterium]|jgi:hypothetical protein